jgi:hypothetical protein
MAALVKLLVVSVEPEDDYWQSAPPIEADARKLD